MQSQHRQIGCPPPEKQMDCESEEISDSCSSDDGLKEKMSNFGTMCEDSSEESCDEVGSDMFVSNRMVGQQVQSEQAQPQVQQKPIGAETPGGVSSSLVQNNASTENAEQRARRRAEKKKQRAIESQQALNAGKSRLKQKYDNQRVKQFYRVEVTASLKELAADPSLSKWKMSESKSYLYQKESKNNLRKQGDRNNMNRVGDPEKAVIESFKLTLIDSDMPVNIAVSSPDIPSNMYMGDGSSMLFAVNRGEYARLEKPIYDSVEALEDKHMKAYGHLSPEDIKATYTPYMSKDYLVRADSPIVDVMNMNQDMYGAILNRATVFDDKEAGAHMVKLGKEVVDSVTEEICGLLSSLPHSNMKKFSLNLRRSDGLPWDSPDNIKTFNGSQEQIRQALEKKHTIVFEFEMSHVLTTLH